MAKDEVTRNCRQLRRHSSVKIEITTVSVELRPPVSVNKEYFLVTLLFYPIN